VPKEDKTCIQVRLPSVARDLGNLGQHAGVCQHKLLIAVVRERPALNIGADQFRVVGIWVMLCLGVIQARAQEAGDRPPRQDDVTTAQSEDTSYMLSGTVLNSVTGEPVRRAAVQVSGQGGSVALTDSGGHFVLEGLAEGSVFLTAMKPGFFADEGNATPAQVGKDAPAVVLKLTPSSVIRGRVTTKDELPIEGLQVRLFAKQNVEGRMVWADQPFQGHTDDDGEFRIPGLHAGSYYVAVDQSEETMLSQKGIANPREQVFPRVFYPGVSDMSTASAIELDAGGEADADFTLSPEPVYHVTGNLSSSARAVSTLTFKRKAGEDTDFSDDVGVQGGRFDAKIPAGAYSVSAQAGDGLELTTVGSAVLVRRDETDLQVPLTTPPTIPVEFVKEQGSGSTERRVGMQEGVPGVVLQLDPVSQSLAGVNPWRAQAGGIPNVTPGTYRLLITTTGEWWVKSARSGGVDLLTDDLTVVEGEQLEPIEVVVRQGAATVSGTVPVGDPGHVIVLLVQQHGSRNFIRSTIATQGNFTISGVPPGDYAIVALNDGDRLEYANPESLNPYLSDAEQISVRARGTAMVNLGLTAVEK
jgi:Carboxypeptidase regulatory-like domain